jgi:hypothetical protein
MDLENILGKGERERERERLTVGLDLLALVDAFVSWKLFSTNSGLGGAFERIAE